MKIQESFINSITDYLKARGIYPRTLGVTDYNMRAPLNAIRGLMLESNGIISIAFRRTYIEKGQVNFQSEISDRKSIDVSGQWITSPYCQIEPAMAFQLGLPMLILREKGVLSEGILQPGVAGIYLPEFDLDKGFAEYFDSLEWKQLIGQWESYVRQVAENKGIPPRLYNN